MSKRDRESKSIAVVGVSALFPGSVDARGFWADILAGRDLVTEVPPTHWLVEDYYDPDPAAPDKTYCKRGAFLSTVDFDPMEFGVPPTIMPATDTAQILALVVAQKVLEDASQGQFASMDRERMSVVLGVTSAQELLGSLVSRLQRPVWIKALRESGIPESKAQAICDRIATHYVPWQESSFPGLLGNVVAGRIANRFDLHGTNAVTDAACASSIAAVSMAMNELQLGQSDLVITGGVDTMNDIFMYMCFSKTPALSPTGDCRPFSDAADGTLLGEGIGMMALKRLADAERDGDRVYAVIRGLGAASDGRSKSVYAPVADGQARALRRAYEDAGYGPETVELVEAHGTGTKAGDVAEFEGLRLAFAESGRSDTQWCALGSVKSQVGHTKAAAGAAGMFKAIMALHHKVLPPTIKVERPNPALDLDKSPFYLNTRTRPWIRDGAHPRRASVSSFGFGGSNFHVTLEEYVPSGANGREAWRYRTTPTELVLIGDSTATALVARCRAMVSDGGDLVRIARESQERFNAADRVRLSIVAASAPDLAEKLTKAAAAIEKSPDQSFLTATGTSYSAAAADAGGVAFLFPGQGSQYLGMGADVAMSIDAARAVWDEAAGVLFDGERIDRVAFPPPTFSDAVRDAQAHHLTATEWAQPALAVHSAALLNVLRALGVKPDAMAGHSFGEVTALHAAGAFDRTTLLRIARRRGELMRDASSSPGAMTAVAGPLDEVRPIVEAFGGGVVIANHNAPTQCVLSGATETVERVEDALVRKGLTVKRLNVATAFHSPLVAPSSRLFEKYLGGVDVAAPAIDVYGTADADVYPREARAVAARLAAQIARPVRFVDQIEALYARGIRTFVEVGPGSVLTDLVGRILAAREHRAINLDRARAHGVTSLQIGLGRLAVSGVALDFNELWRVYAPPRETTAKKPAMAIPVSGINVGKPYPPVGGAKDLPAPVIERERPAAVERAALASSQSPEREVASPMERERPAPMDRELGSPMERERPVPVDRELGSPMEREDFSRASRASDVHFAWVNAYQEAQRQTAEAHAAYQRAMADSHLAFLKTAEASFASLSALLTGEQRPATTAPAEPIAPREPEDRWSAKALAERSPTPIASIVAAPPPPVESIATGEAATDAGDRSAEAFALHNTATPPVIPPAPPPLAGPAADLDLEALLMAVVSDKTGYPAEMLAPHMELEADLGIDSIKRVEILAAMRERAPGQREVKAADFAALRTLGQIVEHMRAGAPASPPADDVAPAQPAAPAPSTATHADIQRFALREVAAPPVGMALPGLFAADRVFVTDDRAGLAEVLAAKLVSRGVRASVVVDVPAGANAVIFLGGMRPVSSVDDAVAVNRDAFRAARVVAADASESGGVFVTVQDTGGDFGLRGSDGTRAWLGGLAALARTAALEWPRASVKAIDCERGDRGVEAIADAICTELFEGGATVEVGLRADGSRATLSRVAAAVQPAAAPRLGPDSLVVASGGARGVTAAAIVALARAHRPRIVLLGRTSIEPEPAGTAGVHDDAGLKRALLARADAEGRTVVPAAIAAEAARITANREIRATLDALDAAGSPARYIAVDVQNVPALDAALESVRRDWGPVTAIVHGAGILADKRIAEKTDEQFDRVFDTKVAGLRALLAATSADPISTICLFSSVAARTGNPGQCDYAMANEVLNLVACAERARRGSACTVRSIGWGPWEGGMVSSSLKAYFKEKGVALIPLDRGAAIFADEMNSVGDDVMLVVGGATGGGPLGAYASTAVSVEVGVDARSHAFLGDHRIGGAAVVPVAMAVEWMLRGARACRPDLTSVAVRNVRVLRGITLQRFEQGGDRFLVNCRQISNGAGSEIAAELRAASGTLHYDAVVDMAGQTPVAPAPPAPPILERWTAPEVYDGHVLFHGDRFRVIQSLDGVSRAGIAGTLAAARDVGWSADAWCTDPALLDGGLQLAVLWARHVLGGASLPMAVRELRTYARGLAAGPIRCFVYARQIHAAHAVCDVSFADRHGALIAEMFGVETVLRPGEVSSANPAGVAQV